jgi:hypothetical protein
VHDRVRTPRGTLLFAVVVLVAEWLGHAGVWFLTGGVGPGQALTGSMHAYLQPLGATLGLAAAGSAWLVLHALASLERRAARLRTGVRRAWRLGGTDLVEGVGDDVDGSTAPAPRSWQRGDVGPVAAALLVAQLTIYLIQENLEVRASGLAWPGLRVLTAHHGSALAIHAVVAVTAAVVLVSILSRWADRHAAVGRIAALYRALTARRTTSSSVVVPGAARASLPSWPLGDALWPRPPPLPLPH